MTFAGAPAERLDESIEEPADDDDVDTQATINSLKEGDDSHVSAELAA